MKLIQELLWESSVTKMHKKMHKIEEAFDAVSDLRKSIISEGPIEDHNGPMEAEFDELSKRMDAARRGLGLANRLKTPEERQMHKRRILGNLNRIRSLLRNIMAKLGADEYEPAIKPNYSNQLA